MVKKIALLLTLAIGMSILYPAFAVTVVERWTDSNWREHNYDKWREWRIHHASDWDTWRVHHHKEWMRWDREHPQERDWH